MMIRTQLALAAAITAALTVSAPGAAERIRLVNINGYSVIDNQHIVLNGGASRDYLVTLQRRCPGLRFGAALGTSFSSTTTLVSPRMEYISTTDDRRCYIDTIETVESIDAARALVEERASRADTAQ